MRKRIGISLLSVLIIFTALFTIKYDSHASGPTDEILNYDITIDVNDDATLSMYYHIDWKVLQSGGDLGPVTWVNVGIPNSHCENLKAQSDSISRITMDRSGGETLAKITFDRAYYEGEVISFDFSLTQDYMYEVNKLSEGQTVYTFTPGWFSDLTVDQLMIMWKSDKVAEYSPSAEIYDPYIVWTESLDPGQ